MNANRLLWLALTLTLLASLAHSAASFGRLEVGGPLPILTTLGPWLAIAEALAIDAGLAAVVWSVRERSRRGQSSGWQWCGVVIFAAVSLFTNVDHGLAVVGAGQPVAATWAALALYDKVRVIVLSAALPAVVVFLSAALELAAEGDEAPTTTSTTSTTTGNDKRPARAPKSATSGRTRERSSGKAPTDAERSALIQAAQRSPDASIADLGRSLGVPRQTVSRWVGGLSRAGELARTDNGWHVPGGEA